MLAKTGSGKITQVGTCCTTLACCCKTVVARMHLHPKPCGVDSQDTTEAHGHACCVVYNAAICHHLVPGHVCDHTRWLRHNHPDRVKLDYNDRKDHDVLSNDCAVS